MSKHESLQEEGGAVLVGVDFGQAYFDDSLDELELLAQSAGLHAVAKLVARRKVPDAALYLGSGKVQELLALANSHNAQEIIFDQALSPAQQRNLEKQLQRPVYDRVFLILEIFAQRARSYEGKLQVELARLQYLSTRLVRRWTHLERQRGGIGGRGGPGETQIELDRRMIGDSIKRVRTRLKKVQKQRDMQRRQRKSNEVFGISLVGYTNAGKSSLFNALVKAQAYQADQLFATLDTTTRQMYLQEAQKSVSLSDTVGFIRDLPHGLVDAFKATLQESVEANLLLHIVDAANPLYFEQIEQVQDVLDDIGAGDVAQVLIFNKLDLVEEFAHPYQLQGYMELRGRRIPRLYVSAKTGEGLHALRSFLADWVVCDKELAENTFFVDKNHIEDPTKANLLHN